MVKMKPQTQDPIPVELDKKQVGVAVKNGNNAAWLCVCGYRLPLIWSQLNPGQPVKCGGCGGLFKGELEATGKLNKNNNPEMKIIKIIKYSG